MAEEIRDIARHNLNHVFPQQEAYQLYERVCDLVRHRNQLREEVAHLQETLGLFAALRDLMYDDSSRRQRIRGCGAIRTPWRRGRGGSSGGAQRLSLRLAYGSVQNKLVVRHSRRLLLALG